MMRIIKWIFWLFFLCGVLLGILTVNSIEDSPIVSQQNELDSNELKRVKRFIQQNNPTRLKSGQSTNTQISQQDLNLALNYISQKAPGPLAQRISSKVILDKDQAYVQASLHLPSNPIGQYINIAAVLEVSNKVQTSGIVQLNSLSIGKINLPAIIARPLAEYMHKLMRENITEYKLVSEAIQSINFENKQLTLNYIWDKQAIDSFKTNLSSRVISDELKQALIAQSNKLSVISYKLGARPGLNELLKPMFSLAKERSQKINEKSDPIIENQAVFIALGAYALNKNISDLFDVKDQKKIKIKKIYLKRRHDLSKHLLISAGITSMADSSLAEDIGLEKEVNDSDGGSGFSFADLAADLAGIRLAEYAVKNEQQARDMQNKMSSIIYETDYMPAIDHLPEGISKDKFNNDYVNTAAYKTTELMIKQRIDQLVIYQ